MLIYICENDQQSPRQIANQFQKLIDNTDMGPQRLWNFQSNLRWWKALKFSTRISQYLTNCTYNFAEILYVVALQVSRGRTMIEIHLPWNPRWDCSQIFNF